MSQAPLRFNKIRLSVSTELVRVSPLLSKVMIDSSSSSSLWQNVVDCRVVPANKKEKQLVYVCNARKIKFLSLKPTSCSKISSRIFKTLRFSFISTIVTGYASSRSPIDHSSLPINNDQSLLSDDLYY